jgi:hypothetical protein
VTATSAGKTTKHKTGIITENFICDFIALSFQKHIPEQAGE